MAHLKTGTSSSFAVDRWVPYHLGLTSLMLMTGRFLNFQIALSYMVHEHAKDSYVPQLGSISQMLITGRFLDFGVAI